MPLTAINKKFLKETLQVEFKPKKGFMKFGTEKDDAVAGAKEKFKEYKSKEEAVIKQIAELKKIDGNDPDLPGLEKEVEDAQKIPGTAAVGNAQDAQAKIQQALDALSQTETKLSGAIQKATDRKAYEGELSKAEELLKALTQQNKDGINFDKPLQELVDGAKNQAKFGNYAPANTSLKNAKTIHDQQNPKRGEYDQYLTQAQKAKDLERKLTVMNRSDSDEYEKDLADAIKAAQTCIDEAKKEPEKGHVADALKKLKNVQSDYDKQVKEAADAEKNALNAARHEPVYTDKVKRINAAIDKLAQLPGTKDARDKLEALKTNAAKFVPQDYEKAYQALKGLTKAEEEGEKAAATFHETAGGTKCKKPLKDAETALKKFAAIAGLGQSKVVDDKQEIIDKALKEIEGNPKEDRLTKLAEELDKLAKELTKEVADQKQYQQAADTSAKGARDMFDALKKAAPLAVWEKFRQAIVEADTLLGLQQYQDAQKEYGDLVTKMTPLHKTADTNLKTWKTKLEEYDSHKEELKEALKVKCTAVSTLASNIHEVVQRQTNEMQQTHDYASGCVEVQKALDTMADVRTNTKAYNDVEKDTKKATAAITDKTAKVKDAEATYTEFTDADRSDFKARLAKLSLDVNVKFNTTLFPSAAKVNEFRDQTLDSLEDLLTEMKPGAQAKRIKQAGPKGLETQFKTAVSEAKKALATLADDDPTQAKTWQGELDKIEKDADGVVKGGGVIGAQNVKEATELKKKVDDKIKENKDAVDKAQKEARAKAKELLGVIDKLEKGQTDSKGNSDYKDYFAHLRDRIGDYSGMYESSVLTVVEKGKKMLEEFGENELKDLKEENAKGSTAQNTFKAVKDKIAAIKKEIEDSKPLKECLPSRQNVLRYRIEKDVADEARKVSPTEALTRVLKDFEVEVGQAITLAKDAATTRKKLETDGKDLKKKLENLADAPQLKKSLTARVEAAMKPGEQTEAAATLDMELVGKLIDEAIKDVDGRTKMETKASQDAAREKLAKETWEAQKDVFEKNFQRKAEEVYKKTTPVDVDKDGYNKIGELYEQAKKLAKAGNHPTAVMKLEDAISAANVFIEVPVGNEATVRSFLTKVNKDWKRVVAGFVAGINAMRKKIEEENKTPPAADLTVIEKQLKRVRKLFNPDLFDGTVATFLDPKANVADKRTEKEHALRRVREYRRIEKTDKVLAYLASKNPFFPPFTTKNIRKHLNLLELNLLRA